MFPMAHRWAKSLLAFVFVFGVLRGYAQDFRATFTGVVSDTSGAVIPGAKVTAVNNSTQITYTGVTTAKGGYFIPYVLPGAYTLSVTAANFKTMVQEHVLVTATQVFKQNFTLQVGQVSEKVVVTAAPPQLDAVDASEDNPVSARTIENVPLNGGEIYALIGTTPGSQPTYGAGTKLNGYNGQSGYIMGGGISGNNQFTLNGSNVTSQYAYDLQSSGEWTIAPNMDSVQEMDVMTTTYDARYGRTSGGTVNTVTKSGSNQFHGTARYAFQGTALNANYYQNNLDGAPRNGEVQNQFWITAGGPIIRNRLFFFFGFEGFHQSLQSSLFENLAPAFLRPGYQGNSGINFGLVGAMDPSEFPNGLPVYQPGSAICLTGGSVDSCNSNKLVQTEFPNDDIPGSMINPTAAGLLQYLPLPNVPNALNLVNGNNYFVQTPTLLHYNQPQFRVDYSLSDRTKLYSYFVYSDGANYHNGNGIPTLAENGNVDAVHQTYVATQDVTHVFTPNMTGDFKISWNRYWADNPNGVNKPSDPTSIGLTMPLPPTVGVQYFPQFNILDGWGTGFLHGNGDTTLFGNDIALSASVTNDYSLNVDFTATHSRHTLEFGGEIDEDQFGGYPNDGGNASGAFSYDSGFTQFDPENAYCYSPSGSPNPTCKTFANDQNGSALASFYLGYPSSGHIEWVGSLMEGYPVSSIYFQDDVRITKRLTLDMGIRYDVQRGLRERHNYLNRGICMTCINPIGQQASYQANVANGANVAAWNAAGINVSSLSTVLGGIEFAGTDGQSRDAYNTDWTDVGPRFGFGFTVNPRTVIRGGYGVLYSFGLEGGSSVGMTENTNYTSSLDSGIIPTNYFQTGNPFASGLVKPTGDTLGLLTDLGNGGVEVDFPNRRIPIEQVMSLGFQRELTHGLVLDARYAGTFTGRLRTFLWKNGTASLAQEEEAINDPAYFNEQLPNPYYGVPGMSGPGECGTGKTIPAVTLRTILPQYCKPGGNGLVGEFNAPIGGNFYNGLEVKVNKRVTSGWGSGLSFQIAYTFSRTMNEDGYRNGWPYQDLHRIHQLGNNDRTHVLVVTSVYNLPIGRGGLLWSHPSDPVNTIIGGWILGAVLTAESGTPVEPDTGWFYTCTHSYRPTGGTRLGDWFSTANDPSQCWSGIPPYGLMNLTGTTQQVRTPIAPDLDLSLMKTFPVWRRATFQLRLDAFNATNSVLFGGPDTNPGAGPAKYTGGAGWSGFGTIGPDQQNVPRVLQIQGKFQF